MTTGILKRMAEAPEKVYARRRSVAKVVDEAGIPYAVVGGNAVAAWIARIDAGEVRNLRDVNFRLDRGDWEATRVAMKRARVSLLPCSWGRHVSRTTGRSGARRGSGDLRE